MRIKYFIIQSISSALLLVSILFTGEIKTIVLTLALLGSISLIIKIAASPFHQWFIGVTKNSGWRNGLLLMTWQKLAPSFLLLFQLKLFILPFLFISSLIGSIFQYNKSNLLEILAFSSVFNLRWLIIRIILNTKIFLIFSLLYWISVFFVVYWFFLIKKSIIKDHPVNSQKKWVLLLAMANLAGIPPLAGFLAKWLVFVEGAKESITFIISILLVTSSINFYIYLRIIRNVIILKTDITTPTNIKKNLAHPILFRILRLTPTPLLFVLGYAWIKGLFW